MSRFFAVVANELRVLTVILCLFFFNTKRQRDRLLESSIDRECAIFALLISRSRRFIARIIIAIDDEEIFLLIAEFFLEISFDLLRVFNSRHQRDENFSR